MSVLGEIIQLAKETATRIQERTTYLYQEYLEAENLASEKKALILRTSHSIERRNFKRRSTDNSNVLFAGFKTDGDPTSMPFPATPRTFSDASAAMSTASPVDQ